MTILATALSMTVRLRSLQTLPLRSLGLISVGTFVIMAAFEQLVLWGSARSTAVASIVDVLLYSPIGMLTPLAFGIGVGTLAFWLFERYTRLPINSSNVWSLFWCLLVTMLLRNLVPFPAILTNASTIYALGMLAGVFWRSGHKARTCCRR